MSLPPSIQAIYKDHCDHEDDRVGYPTYSLVWRIAHEACRLQREADAEQASKYGITYAEDMPLVVPEPAQPAGWAQAVIRPKDWR